MNTPEEKTSSSAHSWQKIENVFSSEKVVRELHKLGKEMRESGDTFREAGLAVVQIDRKLRLVPYPISETEDEFQLSHEIPDNEVEKFMQNPTVEYLLDLHFHPRLGSRYKPYVMIPSFGDLIVETEGLISRERGQAVRSEYFAIAQEQFDESIKILVVKTPVEISERMRSVWPNDQTISEYEGFKEENVIELLSQAGLEAMFLTIPPKQTSAQRRLNKMDL